MTKAVLKYRLEAVDVQEVRMPLGAEILHVHDMFVWARVDLDQLDTAPRRFLIHGTGHHMDERARRYRGTCHTAGGRLVFHVFTED